MRKFAFVAVVAAALVTGSAGVASALDAYPCPEGYTGVIVEHNGRQTSVCQNLLP